MHRCYLGDEIALFHGSHNGYTRLASPVTHERRVIGWGDNVWMVMDRATGEGVHRLDLRWHLSPDCVATATEVENLWRFAAQEQALEIVLSADSSWSATCETGNWSPAYGAVIPSPVLHLFDEGPLPQDCVTILALNQLQRVSIQRISGDGADIFLCKVGEVRRLVALRKKTGPWRFGPIESDAELFEIKYSTSGIQHVLISGGLVTYICGESPVIAGEPDGVREWTTSTTIGPLLGVQSARKLPEILTDIWNAENTQFA